jgi:hypothetical protein
VQRRYFVASYSTIGNIAEVILQLVYIVISTGITVKISTSYITILSIDIVVSDRNNGENYY